MNSKFMMENILPKQMTLHITKIFLKEMNMQI
jgi:hypothetical protein